MNYDKKQFNRLVSYCRKKLSLKILVINNPFIKEPDGCCYYEGNEYIYIEVSIPKSGRQWNLYASILIHEVCHQQLMFRPHSESEVWEHGKTLFPDTVIPKNYDKYKATYLATYGKDAKIRKR